MVGGEEYFLVWFWWRVKGERKWKRKMHKCAFVSSFGFHRLLLDLSRGAKKEKKEEEWKRQDRR